MKKIIILMPELFHGGAEKQFRAIAEGLNKNNYDVLIVDEHIYDYSDMNLNKEFLRKNNQIQYIELKRRKCGKILKYILVNKDMLLIVLKNKPDLVFSSSLKLAYLCKLLNIPFVYSERNSAMGYGVQKRIALSRATKVTCNSIVAQKNISNYGIDVQYIANGIEKCEMIDKKLNTSIIIVPARISADKNQKIVLEAMKLLPESNKLILVGKISENDYFKYLQTMIDELELKDRVNLIEYTNDIKSIYQKSDVVVLPSITEGLSNVILESYMYGRLCVLSDIPQNRIAGASHQRYFEVMSAKMLAEKIEEVLLLSQDEYREECIRNYEYVNNEFGMKKMVYEYKKVFDEIFYKN